MKSKNNELTVNDKMKVIDGILKALSDFCSDALSSKEAKHDMGDPTLQILQALMCFSKFRSLETNDIDPVDESMKTWNGYK